MSDKNINNEEVIDLKEELEKPSQKETSKDNSKSAKRKRRRIIFGGIFTSLAVIGVVSIIFSGINLTARLLDNTAEKSEYEELLSTLVMFDPLPFESVDQLDIKTIYLSGLWSAVINEDMEQFEKNEYGETYLPAIVMDSYIKSVFGNIDISYTTFESDGVQYTFDEEKQAYIIPVTNIPTGYTPKVEDIDQELFSSEKTLLVGYIAPASSWSEVVQTQVTKYVEYIFQRQDGEYYLVAVRESDKEVEVIQPTQSPQTPPPTPTAPPAQSPQPQVNSQEAQEETQEETQEEIQEETE